MKNWISKLVNRTVSSPKDEINYYREKIFNIIALSFIVTGFFALVAGIYASIHFDMLIIVFVDLASYLLLLLVFLNQSIKLQLRKLFLVFLPLALGFFFMLILGPGSPGFAYLVGFNILSAILLGVRATYISLIITLAILIINTAVIHFNFLPAFAIHEYNTIGYFAAGINMILIGSISSLPLAFMVEMLERRIFREKELQFILSKNVIELSEAKVKAEESDKLKSSFLANMSHEIRTPLNAILGFSELLMDDTDLESKDKDNFITAINKSGNYLFNIIENILDISMIEANQLKFYLHSFPVQDICKDVMKMYHPSIKQLDNVIIEFDDKLIHSQLMLHSDAARLKQVFVNLINNAIKFTTEGKITINMQTEGDFIIFSVSDTGKGINENHLVSIFDRFIKGREHKNENLDGAGLGLPISKGILEVLGGDIWVKSKVKKGSTFYFSIPYQIERHMITSQVN